MASLTEQLKNCKLKKVTDPIKDFSSPKTAGYMSKEEITLYQNSVIDVNTEKWMHVLKELTFPTELCPLKIEEAKLFAKIYEKCYKNIDSQQICDLNWRETLTSDEEIKIDDVTKRLESVMEQFTTRDGFAFVKTSSRSAKDAPMVQRRFKDVYHKFLKEFHEDEQKNENIQITCLLRAAFDGLKVKTAEDVVDMMLRSERIYQDMLLALEIESRFEENFIVRKFDDRLSLSSITPVKIRVRTGFQQPVLVVRGDKIWVIEINPFAETTDGGLFSWQHERHLLEGKEGFQFRIVKRPKPGAKAMLPQSIKALLK